MITCDIIMIFTLDTNKPQKNRIKYYKLSILQREYEVNNNINCIGKILRRLLLMKYNKLIFWFGIMSLFIGLHIVLKC